MDISNEINTQDINAKEVAWELFKKTGDIKYYLMAKKIEGEEDARNQKNRGNSNR